MAACGTSVGSRERRELDEPHTVGVAPGFSGSKLERKSSLADAARSDQRQQACVVDELTDRGDIALAPDQAGEWLGDLDDGALFFVKPAPAGGDQRLPLCSVEVERLHEPRDRPPIRRTTHPALEVGNAAAAEAGPLGQRLLCQPGRRAVAPKELAETVRVNTHATPSAPDLLGPPRLDDTRRSRVRRSLRGRPAFSASRRLLQRRARWAA